jgi:hypothetical protein
MMPDRQSGRSSGVEHNLAKVGVEGSNPFARSNANTIVSLQFLLSGLRVSLPKSL